MRGEGEKAGQKARSGGIRERGAFQPSRAERDGRTANPFARGSLVPESPSAAQRHALIAKALNDVVALDFIATGLGLDPDALAERLAKNPLFDVGAI